PPAAPRRVDGEHHLPRARRLVAPPRPHLSSLAGGLRRGIRSTAGLLGLREGAERLLQPLLLGSVARPVPSPQRVLAAVPDLQCPLREGPRLRRVERRRRRRRPARTSRREAAGAPGER